MTFLRSLAYALIFYPGTALFCLAGVPLSLLGTGPTRSVVHSWVRFNHWAVETVLGIEIRIEGTIPSGPLLIAVKHQSMFETLEMLLIASTPIIVLKRELTRLPLFGWLTRRYGVIPVDRDAGAKALREMMILGREAKELGRPILIFPEGTRVAPGERPQLRPGFAGLYRTLGLPVVPVAVDSGRLWGRGLTKQPGVITFTVGQPIPQGLKRDEIEQCVHAAINALDPT